MPPEETPEDSQFNTPLKQIRTFQGDIADALKNEKQSLVSIQRAEQSRAAESEPMQAQGTSKTLWLTLGTLALLALGMLGGSYAYKEYVRKTAPPTIAAPANRFISATNEVSVDASGLTREALINVIQSQSAEAVSAGEIRHLILRKGVGATSPLLTTTQLFTTLETRAPASLVRALDPLFMYGVLGGEKPSSFIILKIRSYENAFAGMLDWEPDLPNDLGPLMQTREALKSIPPQSVFLDDTDRNKDIRVLRDSAGSSLLLYSLLDRDFIIITDNLDALRTLIERLTREKLTR